MLIRKLVLMAVFLLGCSVTWADDAQARQMVQSARAIYDADSLYAQERAFEQLYDAYGQAHSYDLRLSISEELLTVYRNYGAYVKNHVASFLEESDEKKESLYRKLANYGDARGKRLYGQLLYKKGEMSSGLAKFAEAASLGDAAAAYFMAEINCYGLGVARDAECAYEWLVIAAQRNYEPAMEELAAIHWDGDGNWNAERNQRVSAEFLDKAIVLYSQWKLADSGLHAELQTYIESLRRIRAEMQSFIGYDTGKVIAGFYPSYLALRLSIYSENEVGLRARAYYIKSKLNKYGGTYHLAGLPNIDLSKIPIRLSVSEPQWLGQAKRSFTSSDSINLQIDVHVENFSDITDETSRWRREIAINGTIAHEMAHCFLFCKYYHIFSSDYIYSNQLVEGHANNAEYAFVNAVYFYQGMSAERFAREHCSVDYGNYFRWYRNHCLLPNGTTDWSVIEWHERVASPTGEGGKVRTLVPGPDGIFKAPFFFR